MSQKRWLLAGLLLLVTLFLSFDRPMLQAAGFNAQTGAWPLLGEQGATLAWVEAIRQGGVYGRDFFSLYGPMFIYPLSWIMEWFGPSVQVERWFLLLLNNLALVILLLVLLRSLSSHLLVLLFTLVAVVLFSRISHVSANTSLLRSFLPLLTLLAFALWQEKRHNLWLVVAGVVLGQSLLFSQEAGFSAILGLTTMVILARERRPVGLLILSFLLSLAPMLFYLISQGAGMAMLDSLIGYPRLVMLGFGAIKFPGLREWLGEGFYRHWIHYAVLFSYGMTLVALVPALLRQRPPSPRLLLVTGLLVYGLVLFRQALGRSSPEQTVKVMIPALLLFALWLDALWSRRQELTRGWQLVALCLLVNLAGGILFSPYAVQQTQRVWASVRHGMDKFRAESLPDTGIPRVDVRLDGATRDYLREVGEFLQRHTEPGEAVYFFPNEAIGYFLFQRPNPTRYAIAYFAASHDRQREVIADLEHHSPRFVVVYPKSWRVDGIPEKVQIPLIVTYLEEHYQVVARGRQAVFLQRRS